MSMKVKIRSVGPLFKPWGPYDLPQKAYDLSFDFPAFKAKVQEDGWTDEAGCYVICSFSRNKLMPLYIGKTTKSLIGRIYQHRQKINIILETSKNLKVFFLHYEKGRGKLNSNAIDILETELIRIAAENGRKLENIKKMNVRQVRIAGVLKSPPGRKTESALQFSKALGIGG